jgi:hypothetical protein
MQILLFLILISVGVMVHAQEKVITGLVTDQESGKTVGYTSVLNFSRQDRVFSNSSGRFSIVAREGDTLVFYTTGYFYEKVIARQEMLNPGQITTIHLKPQVYEIAEARILGFGTYDNFKQQFLDLDQPETETEKLNETMAEVSKKEAVEAYNKAMAERKTDGITIASVPIRTRDERERLALAKIMEEEKVRDQIYQKFNPMVVKNVTGLTEDDEIIEFMVFCKYSDAYLLQVTDYMLMESIAQKYEEFRRRKEQEKEMQNSINWIDENISNLS